MKPIITYMYEYKRKACCTHSGTNIGIIVGGPQMFMFWLIFLYDGQVYIK